MRQIVRRSVVIAVALLAVSVLVGWLPPVPTGSSVSDQRAAVVRLLGSGFPVYCGGDAGNAVALTFDDGPGPYTARTLDTLARYQSQGTFFDLGSHVVRFPGLTRREAREGVVGDHSWSHPVLTTLPIEAIYQELRQTQQAIALRAGQPPAWVFRPPYGASDARVDSVSRQLGMLTVLWDLAPDVGSSDPDTIAVAVAADARPGSIILLHENNNRGATLAALTQILSELAFKGLRAVTLPELLASDPPTERQLRTGPYGCGPTVTSVSPAQGPTEGGTLVTISGLKLPLPQRVYFGTRLAQTITAMPDGTIQVLAPAGSGTVDVTVTTHFGPSPTSTLDHFTYR
jgi:peptidoglycan-N-acetylglucosamine deacetylase